MIDNKYTVIDAHCHIYPERIAAAAINHTDNFYSLNSNHLGTVSDLIEVGDRFSVDRFIVQSLATTPHQVRSINDFISGEVKKHPDRLIGLGTMHPESRDIAGDLEHLIEVGLLGVKLHPDIQDFKCDDYRLLKIYELCEKKNIPILIHAGDSRYDNSNPNRLFPIVKTYEGLTFVAAHLGGWSVWPEAAEKLAGLKNLYVDSSSSLPFMTSKNAKECILAFGTDRVLFGTDYPMWSADDEMKRLLKFGFTEEEYQNIFSKNAIRAFGIK